MPESDINYNLVRSDTMEKYNREQRSKEDPYQTVFIDGNVTPKPSRPREPEPTEGTVMCPFCLTGGTADKFAFSVKSGFHCGLGKCPTCGNMSQWKTLRRRWTVRDFAAWCYAYSVDGFWSKVNFKLFNSGLAARGISRPFWDHYHMLKGDDDETSHNGDEGD